MQALTENRPITKLTLFDGKKCYVEMTRDDAKEVMRNKQKYILTDGNVIASSLVVRIDEGSGLDFYKAFIYEKMPLQTRQDFMDIMTNAERVGSKLSLNAVLYYLKEKKRQREYYSIPPLSDEQKAKRKIMAQELVERMNKFFNKK